MSTGLIPHTYIPAALVRRLTVMTATLMLARAGLKGCGLYSIGFDGKRRGRHRAVDPIRTSCNASLVNQKRPSVEVVDNDMVALLTETRGRFD